MRRAVTLIEVTIATAIIALICAICTPALLRHLDRSKVRHAASEVMSMLALARSTAVAREDHVSVIFDAVRSDMIIVAGQDTLSTRTLGAIYGVHLRSNRDSVTYGPTGLGYGAANQSIILQRGSALDTVVISRLGRVRH
jgi:Tfp pilus assembly protein FimT